VGADRRQRSRQNTAAEAAKRRCLAHAPAARPQAAAPHAAGRQYRVGRRPIELIDAKRRIAYVGAEQQDKYARYGWNLRVRDLVATGLQRTDLLLLPVTPRQAQRVSATLRACGLSRHASREFLSLSYGQKRLVLLARALVQNPDWLLLDELYNGLDAQYRRRIDAVLGGALRRGQSWVATAHRAGDVPRGTRCMLALAQGSVVSSKRIRPADLLHLAAQAGETPRRGADARAAPQCATARQSKLRGAAALRARRLVLHLSHVDLYVEYRPVLRGLDWQLRKGEQWAVYGANGAGKSSFLKLLYGDLSPALGGVQSSARISRGHADRGVETADRLRVAGAAKRLCRRCQRPGSGRERPLCQHRPGG
jgi:molybdate transport system ATP-binding protein